MSGILVPNGIKRLDLFLGGDNSPRITRHQAALLCEAVASSSSLEQLWIQASFENLDEMGRSFVRTLGQNRSLKAVHLLTSPFNDRAIVPNLLKAAVLQTKVKDLRIGLYGGPLNELPMDVLVDVVCRSDCSLCRLSLVGILIDPVDYTGAKVTEKNSSVEELELISFGRARFEDIMRVLLLFNSLKRLDLSQNSISSDLAPLDTLLMTADRSAMEKLTLNENDITEDNFKSFLNKLPWMHSLKSLEVGHNPALNSESCLNALKDAVWLNKSLEHVYYENDAEDAEETIPNLQHIDSMIRLATSLNRGAKRKILNEYPLSLPQNLWAHVLKRAMTIKYYDFNFNDNTPTLTSPRLDVVFWLLREKMLC